MKRRIGICVLVLALVGLVGSAVVAETYTVASDTTWPPFEWADAAGNLYGFDLDAMRCIAVVEGFEIDIISYDWDIIFNDVGIGRVDIGASGATITEERELKVDFSDPYWTSDQAIMVRADSGLNVVSALTGGKTVGAQLETTGAGWIQENLIDQGVDVKLSEYPLYPLAVLDLINGNIDTVIQDEPAAAASAAVEEDVIIVGIVVTGEEFGFFVADGDPEGLLPMINSGIKKLQASGAWDNLIKAYVGTDLGNVEAAWQASEDLLEAGDVDGFAQSLADLANK
ncbi:MAG TPA: transporter substrate-binding domain-containing protein [Candidatus Heimdallarchaeota archaeon]|nr:transporter substrate-binding domain-containing protein [Candidatus Heimdallarchaeota archaeon]